ncbi:hypothetical protein INR49_026821, partial [Caranx melampygus]
WLQMGRLSSRVTWSCRASFADPARLRGASPLGCYGYATPKASWIPSRERKRLSSTPPPPGSCCFAPHPSILPSSGYSSLPTSLAPPDSHTHT